MTRRKVDRRAALASTFAAALAFGAGAHAQSAGPDSPSPDGPRAPSSGDPRVTPLSTTPLAGIDGKEVSMVVVEYPPGGTSPAHRHDANVFVYVLEGSVVMQVSGGEQMTLTAGQTFYESPTDVHVVSRNASATEPAKFLVFFVRDAGAVATAPAE